MVSRRGPESPPFHSGPPPTSFLIDDPGLCYSKAVDALARRSRSEKGLERWLIQRKFAPESVASAMSRLQEHGFLDDLKFARAFAHSRTSARSFGPRRVATELAREGVARATIDVVLGELKEQGAEAGTSGVDAAAARRARSLAGLERTVAERRLIGWLVRRGFEFGEAARAARSAIVRQKEKA